MEYSKLRNKIGKFYNDGKIQTYQEGGFLKWRSKFGMMGWDESDYANFLDEFSKGGDGTSATLDEYIQNQLNLELKDLGTNPSGIQSSIFILTPNNTSLGVSTNTKLDIKEIKTNAEDGTAGATGGFSSVGMGMIAQAGVGAMKAVDNLTMSDKNFSAQSQAIDSAVHGVSSALMSSGNPYAMAAGAALEGANFLTKAGGQTVQGFDVNIENSGFGTLGHEESSSSRDFGAMIGLGGLNTRKMQAKLARRNEQARMALQAAEISEDVKFEQEARMNSVDNVLRNNLIALAGGIDTSLLGS